MSDIEKAAELVAMEDRYLGIDWYKAAKGMLRRFIDANQEQEARIRELENTIEKVREYFGPGFNATGEETREAVLTILDNKDTP